jgi:dTDP-4-dehydrorhamnose reductase
LDQPSILREHVFGFLPDVVINAAAYTAVDRAESDADNARIANAEAPDEVARACALVGARMIHYSTDYVFNGRGSRPYRETDPPDPLGVYGHTKLLGERAVLAADPRHVVLRVSWVYATRGRNFLLTMRRLASEGRSLRVVGDQTGAPTWARTIAAATAQGALRLPREEPGGLYHLPADGETTWHGFAQAIFAESPEYRDEPPHVERIETADFPTAAQRPMYSRLDGAAFRERFGFALPDWRLQLRMALEP